jgi:RNA polymerase sigma-32 factor
MAKGKGVKAEAGADGAGAKRAPRTGAGKAKARAAPAAEGSREVVDAEVEADGPDAEAEPGVDDLLGAEPAEAALVPAFDDDGDDGAVTVLEAPHDGSRDGDGRSLVRAERGVGRADPLTAYMQELRRYPLLSREEEHELAKQFVATQDPAIAKQLITANLRLVVKIAHEYRRAHRNLLDLVQEGNIGLLQAVRKYDPMRGVKLSSYAAWWIRAYILKFILNNWRMVKIGTTQAQRKLFFNLRKEKDKLEKMGFEPDHKLLAERLDVTEAEVAEMDQRLSGGDSSLDAPLGSGEDGDSRTRMDVLPDAPGSRPDAAVASSEFRTILREKLETFAKDLKGREEILFRERWLTEEPKTLQEIGDSFGISRERARQLEKRMLDRLREYLQAEFGSSVDIGAMVDE